MKKEINVANQPWLGFSRIIQITVDGIRYRLFRASVTVAVIAVAVAFLMNILSESLIKRSVARDTRDRIHEMRLILDWSSRLTTPGNPESVLREVARSTPGGPIYQEVAGMAGLDEATMTAFHQKCSQGNSYLDFFANLDYAKRRNLIHTATGIGIFRRLQTPNGMEQFTKSLADIHSIRFTTSLDDLNTFLTDWGKLQVQLQAVVAARAKAVAQIRQQLAGKPITDALADATGSFGDTVRQAGFVFDGETVAPLVASQAQAELDVKRLQESMDSNACKQLIAQRANVLPADVNVIMMWKYLGNAKFATRYLERMKQENEKAIAYEQKMKNAPPKAEGETKATIDDTEQGTRLNVAGLVPERLVELAEARDMQASLLRAERLTVGAGLGFMGLGERLAWLLFVSLLVCGIGIANAMLMTVTERFTEIATLKCLGALDGFIMLMFVLESSFLGVVGGVIGAILGALIGLSRMLAAFGLNFAGAIPATDIVVAVFASVAMGMLLAGIAAVLPSFKAARLAPMEAMRIE